jgi:hypothetical protein
MTMPIWSFRARMSAAVPGGVSVVVRPLSIGLGSICGIRLGSG